MYEYAYVFNSRPFHFLIDADTGSNHIGGDGGDGGDGVGGIDIIIDGDGGGGGGCGGVAVAVCVVIVNS